jgi:hypothetical protein
MINESSENAHLVMQEKGVWYYLQIEIVFEMTNIKVKAA